MDIIATIWKKPYKTEINQKMISAGANVLRIKCSHLSIEELSQALMHAREQINQQSKPVFLLADLPEAKMRLGEFPQGKITVIKGEEFRFIQGPATSDPHAYIPFTSELLGKEIQIGDTFFLGDGLLQFTVSQKHAENEFIAAAQNNGTIIAKSSITVPRLADKLNHLVPEIDELIPHLVKSRPDYIACSFISSRKMMEEITAKIKPLTTNTWQPKFIAKIESREGINNLQDILSVSDGVMVARGDLALNIPFEEIGLVQKRIVAEVRKAKKYSIVSTGILQSMLYTNIPHRSDILDLTNSVLDGASAIMLCTETAHHESPEDVVGTAKRIITKVMYSS